MCTIHQSATLLVNALKLDVDVHDLVLNCMWLNFCAGADPLHAFLFEKLDIDEDNIEDDESEQTIMFKQWSITDQAELVNRTDQRLCWLSGFASQ